MANDKPKDDKAEKAPNPLEAPGFHVVQGNTFLGTYETEEDAQLFIDGHLTPQKKDAKIVEGKVAAEDKASDDER